ncbi:MAG: hypothetical protein HN691_10070 [Bacteroidetes bacterium]|nr:hypothetical protein [Bacteroidota bacterium]
MNIRIFAFGIFTVLMVFLIQCKKPTKNELKQYIGEWEFVFISTEYAPGFGEFIDTTIFTGSIKYENNKYGNLMANYSIEEYCILDVDGEGNIVASNPYCASGQFIIDSIYFKYLIDSPKAVTRTHKVYGKKI